MSKKIFAAIALIICAVCSTLWAQSSTDSDFELSVDYARFRGEQNLTLVEIYFAFSRDSLQHISTGERYIATYLTTLDLAVKDSVIKTIEWRSQDIFNSSDELTNFELPYPESLNRGLQLVKIIFGIF